MASPNGTGPAPDTAPVPTWRLTSDLTPEEELAIRTARLEGLQRRRADQDGEGS